ncbi:MAG: GNAT family N-acetyltransferase [Bacteroidota bacterium]
MIIKTYNTIGSFLADNQAFLEKEEAANNLLLGLPLAMKGKPLKAQMPIMLSVFNDNEVVFSCFQTPPRQMIIYAQTDDCGAEIDYLIKFLIDHNYDMPGVLGRKTLVNQFESSWRKATGHQSKVLFDHLVFQLDELNDIPISDGSIRLATMDDYELVARWVKDFIEEATQDDSASYKKVAKDKIEGKAIYLWENEEIVSMAGIDRPTTHGITVNYVYTPPEFRGKGYASSVVYEMSALMLRQYAFCALFTDLANPTSNKIYQAIGYRPIRAFTQLSIFEEA